MAIEKRQSTDTRRARSRQMILAATSRVLSERGLNLMTVEDILQEAGVARATFYSHFTDKNDATRAVVDEMFKRASQLYQSIHTLKEITPETLRAWLSEAYEQWKAYQAEVSSLVRDFAGFFRSPQFTQLEEFARVLVGDGSQFACSEETALLRARLLIVQLERAMMDTVNGNWPVAKSQLIDELVVLWHSAMTRP
ncbi:TetR/AcrR family transcriptional regulator [Brevundimonas sp. GN22]